MKKLLTLVLVFVLTFSVSGCSQDEAYEMSVKPSEFSAETTKVLDLFAQDLQFYDIKLDETAKSFEITLWLYKDGQWESSGGSMGNVEWLGDQIAIRLTETEFELITITETGNGRSTHPIVDTDFENSLGILYSRIDYEAPITLNTEIPLWVVYGSTEPETASINLAEDFRDIECNAGMAVTLTVSDELVG